MLLSYNLSCLERKISVECTNFAFHCQLCPAKCWSFNVLNEIQTSVIGELVVFPYLDGVFLAACSYLL